MESFVVRVALHSRVYLPGCTSDLPVLPCEPGAGSVSLPGSPLHHRGSRWHRRLQASLGAVGMGGMDPVMLSGASCCFQRSGLERKPEASMTIP